LSPLCWLGVAIFNRIGPDVASPTRRRDGVPFLRRGVAFVPPMRSGGRISALDETRLATMQVDHLSNTRRFETAEYWHVRSQEARSRAEQMINTESMLLMSGLADNYERVAHIVEGMASIRDALTSVTESVNGLLSQQ
jgi:hypothetical protein